MLSLQSALIAGVVLLGLASAVWVFAPALRGQEAARRDVGTHRLALGSLLVILLANAALVAPVAGAFRAEALTSQTFLLAALATEIPMLLLLHFRLIAPGAATWEELGLRPLRLGRVVRVGVGTGLAGLGLTIAIGLLLGAIGLRQNQAEQFTFLRREGVGTFVAVLLLGAIVAPFVEELFFRGFIFGLYRRRQPLWVAYVASGSLFAVLHANPRAMDLGQAGALVVGVFTLGTLLAWAYQRTGSLYPSMVAHGLNNAVAITGVYAVGSA